MQDLRAERLQIMLTPEELSLLDDFRFKHRMPTRAAAVRELLKLGLAGTHTKADGSRSSHYGLFDRGPDGHKPSGDDGSQESI
ncbi:hypothetical protein JQ633_28815 [Bradyrhizobium tropiciagri]|uniref:hypothetical protein n=1 Tax=Bradyrhizobium tropiciagri TaxID=312253 RepID=UPI001BAB8ED4|nr:hypothetical protein [Bradyrhizobium tropiciagri]MBR0874389.1 hypothetical protein [Bradyrhizobium tropiciagri]